jgi:hypothetical protein
MRSPRRRRGRRQKASARLRLKTLEPPTTVGCFEVQDAVSAACRQRVTVEGFAPPLAGALSCSGLWSFLKSSWLASLVTPPDVRRCRWRRVPWGRLGSRLTYLPREQIRIHLLASPASLGHIGPVRRRGRVAEGGSLLNCYRVISSIEGSNPSVSARCFLRQILWNH